MYQKYLVTGAQGPVGKLVVMKLVRNGFSVRALVKPDSNYKDLQDLGVEISEGDLFEKDSLKDFFDIEDPRHSVLIHTEEEISFKSVKKEINLGMRRTNVSGTINLVDNCLKYKMGRFVFLGSAYSINTHAILENQVLHFDRNLVDGEYAKTKAEAGEYIIEKISLNKFNAVILLPTFIIGPGFPENYELNKVLKAYLENGVSTIDGGHAFVDVRDVADCLIELADKGQTGGCYVLNGEYKTADDFFSEVRETSGIDVNVKKASKLIMTSPFSKFADTYYKMAKKDDPREVYSIFMNNPYETFDNTPADVFPDRKIRTVHDSISFVLSGIDEVVTIDTPISPENDYVEEVVYPDYTMDDPDIPQFDEVPEA